MKQDRFDLVKALFLGPKSENHEILEKLIIDVIRDHTFWRRNFHPEDSTIIQPKDHHQEYFVKYHDELRTSLFSFLDRLKTGVPFHSPRYIAHMNSDILISGIIGYIAAMIYNPNNVTGESSPATTEMEFEFIDKMCKSVGYDSKKAWGHITSGGTIANFEAIWVALTLRLLPIAILRFALSDKIGKILIDKKFKISYKNKLANMMDLVDIDKSGKISPFRLLNMPMSQLYNLRQEIIAFCAIHSKLDCIPDDIIKFIPNTSYKEYSDYLIDIYKKNLCTNVAGNKFIKQLTNQIKSESISELGFSGIQKIFTSTTKTKRFYIDIPKLEVLGPSTLHYSFKKILQATGIGKSNLVSVKLDDNYRMDINALNKRLEKNRTSGTITLCVVAVTGSTEEGSVDEVDKIVNLYDEFNSSGYTFFLHNDSAYGGYFCTLFNSDMTKDTSYKHFLGENIRIKNIWKDWFSQQQPRYENFKNCDSITIDPHKLGYIPYPSGVILFKDQRIIHHIEVFASYIFQEPDELTDGEVLSRGFIGPYTLEGSKPGAAAAACWLSEKVLPLDENGYGMLLARLIIQRMELQNRLQLLNENEKFNRNYEFIVIHEPDLNILNFILHYKVKGESKEEDSLALLNFLNKKVYNHYTQNEIEGLIVQPDFVLSETEFSFEEYGDSRKIKEILEKLGINKDQFIENTAKNYNDPKTANKVVILRSVIMNPWLTESSDEVDHTYAEKFVENLENFLLSPNMIDSMRLEEIRIKAKTKIWKNLNGGNIKVLHIEDDPINQKIIKNVIQSEFPDSFELIQFQANDDNGDTGENIFDMSKEYIDSISDASSMPHLILLDINLKDINHQQYDDSGLILLDYLINKWDPFWSAKKCPIILSTHYFEAHNNELQSSIQQIKENIFQFVPKGGEIYIHNITQTILRALGWSDIGV